MMRVVSLNIGERKIVQWNGKPLETGIFKTPVNGPVYLDKQEVRSDTIVDRKHHGGIEQAVYGYSENHYVHWKELYPDLEWAYGMFGENMTISNLEEITIHVGDTYRVGEAIIEVTKPRQPCMKLGVRIGTQKILKQFWNSTKSGVYFKVIQTGTVEVGDELQLLKTDTTKPTIADVYESLK